MQSWCRLCPCLALLLAPVAEAAAEAAATQAAAGSASFAAFTEKYDRIYDGGVNEYEERHLLFQQRSAKVLAHNHKQNRRWTAAINAFSDRTIEELGRLRGWRRRGSPKESSGHHAEKSLSLSQFGNGKRTARAASAKSVSWAFLNSTQRHYNQGSCGSCWAIASSVLLETHSEIHAAEGKSGRTFSAQELVSCVPNPKHCGGTGGCEGATIELAMEWTIKHGLASDSEVPYMASDGECRADKPAEGSSLLQMHNSGNSKRSPLVEGAEPLLDDLTSSSAGAQFGMVSWERLPENEYDALVHAVQEGPVGISVAASDWFDYSHGIFDSCEKDAVIDHAVVLIGYGEDSTGTGYWMLKNSWGPQWGEHGIMRLLKRNDAEENEGTWCGTDHQPEMGSGCDGGPSEVKVCGTCGILYDTVVPKWRGSSEKAKQRALAQELY